ncbi:MAG: hypothetical protein MZV65_52510 [Chromatiales bacterium]|nr:hypothetical protein [Chromatiales bacterium]
MLRRRASDPRTRCCDAPRPTRSTNKTAFSPACAAPARGRRRRASAEMLNLIENAVSGLGIAPERPCR